MRIHRLENPVQRYAWGSSDGIARVLGLPNPGGGPLAEVWMGAHPKAPSLVLDPTRSRALDRLISDDPVGTLGGKNVAQFGPALPFLFKVLSAGKPLSIQAHPGKGKAERGFDRENLGGIPIDAPERIYRDPNHKPEMAVALTGFELLCGFRPIREIVRLMRLVAPAHNPRQVERLETNPGKVELSVFFYSLISVQEQKRRILLDTVRSRVAELLAADRVSGEDGAALRWVGRIMEDFPGDIGAVAPLLLNLVRLESGQAVFIAPGELHAHLQGTCLEIMANSDNVIRGALTPKFVDLPELISVLSFSPERVPILQAQPSTETEERYPVSVPDFALSRIAVDANRLHRRSGGSPEILLCLEGAARLTCPGEAALVLRRGESLFVESAAGEYGIAALTPEFSEAVLYKASVPETT